MAYPLNHLLNKWDWSSLCEKASLEIKFQLVRAPILTYPDRIRTVTMIQQKHIGRRVRPENVESRERCVELLLI